MTYQLKMLFDYTKKNKITDKDLSVSLGVHFNSIYCWRHEINEPSALASSKIREYLIKNL